MKATDEFWKRKLMAFLHDPPCKALDIGQHERMARDFCRRAIPEMTESDWDTFKGIKDADWTGSAADRFVFPQRKCSSKFTGQRGKTFLHPLGGGEYVIDQMPTAARAEELLAHSMGGIETPDFRSRFFLYWRRWMENTVLQPGGQALAYFPADTRIPDHTIWNHIALVSALQACRNEDLVIDPAFLIFQIGPVQDFISQARSTRDLWSASYLLSWLTAHAIKAVTDEIGPDCIISPALRGQGIFDALHREEIYDQILFQSDDRGHRETLWERMYLDGNLNNRDKMARRLLNPSLPNRFVAIVPAPKAKELGQAAEKSTRDELKRIADFSFSQFIQLAKSTEAERLNWKKRWDKQVELFPRITWTAVPWLDDIPSALNKFQGLPVNLAPSEWNPARIINTYHRLATEIIPHEDRDSRYYRSPDRKKELKNPGFLWSLNYHWADYLASARRNTRNFPQFKTDPNQAGAVKDSLTGREEIIGNEKYWQKIREPKSDGPVFRATEGPYGALTIIKRLWCHPKFAKVQGSLLSQLDIREEDFRAVIRFDSVPEIANRNPEGSRKKDSGEDTPNNPYVAVISLDGDEMGKWLSGMKLPPFLDQITGKAQEYIGEHLDKNHIDRKLPRLLTPSFHMQFSEAVSNFANYIVAPIIDQYQGQLIYAGGDDILAIVPATVALACAQSLRKAFQGSNGTARPGFLLTEDGLEVCVPGPRADLSCGIAIAHCDHPLQAIVREAGAAEKRAKTPPERGGWGRGAFAISLLKRGGETIHWGAKWEVDNGETAFQPLDLFDFYNRLREKRSDQRNEKLSSRFPYALASLLAPYRLNVSAFQEKKTILTNVPDFNAAEVIKLELGHIITQQGTWEHDDPERCEFTKLCENYLDHLGQYPPGKSGEETSTRYGDFIGLFLTAAFLGRGRSEVDDRVGTKIRIEEEAKYND